MFEFNIFLEQIKMFIKILVVCLPIFLLLFAILPWQPYLKCQALKKEIKLAVWVMFPSALLCNVWKRKLNGISSELVWFNLLHFCVFPDMIFLQGSEVIFKVALSLLGSHKPLILQHENLETIVDFIKNTLPNLGLVQMEKTISQVRFSPNLSKGSVLDM